MSRVSATRWPGRTWPALAEVETRRWLVSAVVWADATAISNTKTAVLPTETSYMMRHMRSITILVAVTAAFAAETVKTPIDNDQVKVLNVVVQPHEKTRLHQHKVNRVMIYLQAGRQDFDYQDGKKSVMKFKAGEMKWSPAGGMHIAEISSDNPVNIIEVELKKPGAAARTPASALDPVKVDPKHY